MILYLTIAIIIWLALTCVYFINDARKARDDAEGWRGMAVVLEDVADQAKTELQKWKRPRAKNGRFR